MVRSKKILKELYEIKDFISRICEIYPLEVSVQYQVPIQVLCRFDTDTLVLYKYLGIIASRSFLNLQKG